MSAYYLFGKLVFPANKGRKEFEITRFSEVKINSSWEALTDTAEITLPRNVRVFERKNVSNWFREGDPVQIYLGYNGNLNLEFSGYISQVPAGIPLVLTCEDEMYKLKRTTVSVVKKNCTLKELLQAIAPGYTISCDETKLLGDVRFVENGDGAKWSASEILDELKKQGIHSWFEGTTLHAFSLSKSNVDPIQIVVEQTAGESLKQKVVENTLVTIVLKHKKKKATRITYGDEGAGKKITRTYAGITLTESEMQKEAKTIYTLAKTPGLDGDITLFGCPRVQHGYRLTLKSVYYPEKDGTYYVDTVTKIFGQKGFRQQCKIGSKAI